MTKQCSCGKLFDPKTREYVGYQEPMVPGGKGYHLYNCPVCGSTILIREDNSTTTFNTRLYNTQNG